MNESVVRRFSWREFRRAAVAGHADAATLARVHAYFFGAGATLAAIAVFGLETPVESRLGAALVIAAGYAVVAAMVLGYTRIPLLALNLIPALGVVLISAGIHLTGDPTSPYALMYTWVGLMGHLLGTRWMILHLTGVAVGYGIVLLAAGDDQITQQWLLVVGTVAVAGLVVIALTARLLGLIERLGHAARTDPLTGLANRRAFNEVVDLELERVRRGGEPVCLILGDLDHFKHVNDRLGHSEGDHALERVAAVLEEGKRRIDTAARIGGEEFALVLPSCDLEGARALGERLRVAIAERFGDGPVPLTISFGVAAADAGTRSRRQLFDEADQALYRAKAQGGDRCVMQRPSAVTG